MILIHIDRRILGELSERNLTQMSMLLNFLPSDCGVIILSQHCQVVTYAIETMFGVWKNAKRIQVRFIPWLRIEELGRMASEVQASHLRTILPLDGLIPPLGAGTDGGGRPRPVDEAISARHSAASNRS